MNGFFIKVIGLHRFFVRKSQFYLHGNWACYEGGEFSLREILYYPIAYTKFMFWGIRDLKDKVNKLPSQQPTEAVLRDFKEWHNLRHNAYEEDPDSIDEEEIKTYLAERGKK
jgi:hypothetical protein